MGSFIIFIIVLLVILGAIFLGLMFIYNRLVVLKNRYTNAYSQIDVQLKRRYDLIPNLVESSRAYLAHESSTLEAVIQARNTASGARISSAGDPTQLAAMKKLAESDNALNGVMGRLMVVMENYPDLKANQTVADLMEELRSTENRVGFARQAFNDAVMEFNQAREVFPAVLFAGLFGFQAADFWYLENKADGGTLRIDLANKKP
ncbi:MAG: LemA family protein [Deltaproteobacteria bacterium]|jgi:LemA protein|nr:LemA family protein [Deltaproteobacteria bacterium]